MRWPGNLRNLQAAAHRMAVLAEPGRVTRSFRR